MRNAVLNAENIVVNLIEGAIPGLNLVPDDGTAAIGFRWDGSAFVPQPPIVPESVSPRQFRQSLTNFGFRQQVENAVTASADQYLKDWYQFASEFQRHHPEVLAMAQQLGFTSDQLDQVWTYGATL